MLAQVLLKDVTTTTITPTMVWPEAKLQRGDIAPPFTENWIKDLLSMAHLSEQDPDSPPASPSHQEVSTSLFFLSIRVQT